MRYFENLPIVDVEGRKGLTNHVFVKYGESCGTFAPATKDKDMDRRS